MAREVRHLLSSIILVLVCLLCVQGASAQGPKRVSARAKSAQPLDPSKGTLSVVCDLDCTWELDNDEKGKLSGNHVGRVSIDLGWHTIVAKSVDGTDHFTRTLQSTDNSQVEVKVPLKEIHEARLQLQSAETACSAGTLAACVDAANFYGSGSGVDRNVSRAVSLYRRACDGGDGRGCEILGEALRFGQGVPEDKSQGFVLIRKACDLNYAEACNSDGIALDFSKSYEDAAAQFRRGCDLYPDSPGSAKACFHLAVAFMLGQGVEKDDAIAIDFLQKGCDGLAPYSCEWLGRAYAGGRGVARDLNKALALWRKGCDDQDANACNDLRQFTPSATSTVTSSPSSNRP